MPHRVTTLVDVEASQFEASLKAARIPTPLQGGMWDVWVDDPARARHLVQRFKEYDPTRTKAAPGAVSVELPRDLADALAAARADEGDAKITALLRQVAGQQFQVSGGGKVTDSGAGSKLPAKSKTAYESLATGQPIPTTKAAAQPIDCWQELFSADQAQKKGR